MKVQDTSLLINIYYIIQTQHVKGILQSKFRMYMTLVSTHLFVIRGSNNIITGTTANGVGIEQETYHL